MKKLFYRFSDKFNMILFTLAIILILVLLYYSQTIVHSLREQSRTILEFYAQIHSRAAAENDSTNINFLFENIIQKTNFPIINTDENKNPLYWENISVEPNDKSPEAIAKVRKMVANLEKELEPVPIIYRDEQTGQILLKQFLYYGDSNLITRLIWLPYIEIGVFGLFLLVAFLGFRSIKSNEEQSIWVGMAKETAHQLGTPLSSLMGWLELMKSTQSPKKFHQVLLDMENDVNRLNKVANRFSQIGSQADLKRQDIIPIIKDTIQYFQRRLPHMGKKINIIEQYESVPPVRVNRDLFEWVIENLLKNSLDAIEKETGMIKISIGRLTERGDDIFIDISDNGKGISPKNRRLVFRPGFSTKKRGWGLGLNLARRIIVEYHGGKLLIKDTKIGEGTTMRIILKGK
ncbi:MAG: HAMP domain-containing histidine kinase [candidate division KSB1 bacterium]|nr:HAMP domain-containing histidine kinase [candidate division KSB1 bacterium]MDZ7336515.1 HAMP domain-containing histidine kinase [candidate division KSB1 bacterium]MDZ7358605.1 HAMP domain-containing histidine kinase [candidate division KSB1 bacterium]MDZ7401832.1 HAMP domain-containing histidine kinase [candidate division KSB1 bacterium]